jgi:hypothetical protein
MLIPFNLFRYSLVWLAFVLFNQQLLMPEVWISDPASNLILVIAYSREIDHLVRQHAHPDRLR